RRASSEMPAPRLLRISLSRFSTRVFTCSLTELSQASQASAPIARLACLSELQAGIDLAPPRVACHRPYPPSQPPCPSRSDLVRRLKPPRDNRLALPRLHRSQALYL